MVNYFFMCQVWGSSWTGNKILTRCWTVVSVPRLPIKTQLVQTFLSVYWLVLTRREMGRCRKTVPHVCVFVSAVLGRSVPQTEPRPASLAVVFALVLVFNLQVAQFHPFAVGIDWCKRAREGPVGRMKTDLKCFFSRNSWVKGALERTSESCDVQQCIKRLQRRSPEGQITLKKSH